MLRIEKSQLRAALQCAAKGDIRFQLNSVCMEICANGDMHLIGCDGQSLFAGRITANNVRWTEEPQKGGWKMIIPRAAIETALVPKGFSELLLSAMPDGRYSLGDTIFAPVDGQYPDWRRVIPKGNLEVEAAQFNPDLVSRCAKALREWFNKKELVTFLRQHGNNSAIMSGLDNSAFCIVMPRRDDGYYEPFNPAPLTAEDSKE